MVLDGTQCVIHPRSRTVEVYRGISPEHVRDDVYGSDIKYLALLWRYSHLKFFQEGSSRNRGRSSVSPQYYTDLIYSSSLR